MIGATPFVLTGFGVAIGPDAPIPELLDRATTAEQLLFDSIYVPTIPRPAPHSAPGGGDGADRRRCRDERSVEVPVRER